MINAPPIARTQIVPLPSQLVDNRKPSNIQPVSGWYQVPGQKPLPMVLRAIEISGMTQTPSGEWVRIDRARLNPAKTQLNGFCDMPMHWVTQPDKTAPAPFKSYLA